MVRWRMPSTDIELSTTDRETLQRMARARKDRADLATRAQAILWLADGASYATLTERLGWSSRTAATWKQRFLADGIAGLRSRHRGSKPRVLTPRLEARILARPRDAPSDGSTHWSTRKLAKALKITHTLVATVWHRAGLQPHRLDRYRRSTDPEFETKAADVIGLYVQPPQHAAVFCVDEKSAIQALDPLDPILPLSPGRAERTDSSTTATVRCRSMPHSTRTPAMCSARRRRGTPATISWRFSRPSSRRSRAVARFTSSSTIRRRIRRRKSAPSSWRILTCSCTSHPRTRPGSIKLNSGSPKSSATCSRAVSSPQSPT